MESDLELTGRDLIRTQTLRKLREKYGFSRSAQAHMIGVSPTALRDWEDGVPLSRISAERIGAWWELVARFAEEVDQDLLLGVENGQLLHITVASQQLAMSYGTITGKCQSGMLRCVDLGPLGLYLHKDELLVAS